MHVLLTLATTYTHTHTHTHTHTYTHTNTHKHTHTHTHTHTHPPTHRLVSSVQLCQLQHSSLEGCPRQQPQIPCCHGDGILHIVQDLFANLVQHSAEVLLSGVQHWYHRGVQVQGIWHQRDVSIEEVMAMITGTERRRRMVVRIMKMVMMHDDDTGGDDDGYDGDNVVVLCWLLYVSQTCYSISGSDQHNSMCCHTEIEVADQTFYLTQSHYTRPTSMKADPITQDAWHGNR